MPKVKTIASITPILSTNLGVSRAGWSIDYRALSVISLDEETQKNLGIVDPMQIHLPVKIRFQSAKYLYGTHRVKRDSAGNLYHSITLNQNENADQANETLWHELTHCWQSEAWAVEMGKENRKVKRDGVIISASARHFYNDEYRRYGTSGNRYRNNPYEVQAREVAATNKSYNLLKG